MTEYPITLKQTAKINLARMKDHQLGIEFAACFDCRNVEKRDKCIWPTSDLITINNRWLCKEHASYWLK